jgi:hypothetical protein
MEFIDSKEEKLLLLLGNAGSGKSIYLQLAFLDYMENWDSSKPLPLYFNLANGTNLREVVNSLQAELKVNLNDYLFEKSLEKKVIFFIDSFDEGLYAVEERKNLIKTYTEELGKGNFKYLVTSRKDFLSGNDYSDFLLKTSSLQKLYITPLIYSGSIKKNEVKVESYENVQEKLRQAEEEHLKSALLGLIQNYVIMDESIQDPKVLVDMIYESELENKITTGFLFHMTMKTLELKLLTP